MHNRKMKIILNQVFTIVINIIERKRMINNLNIIFFEKKTFLIKLRRYLMILYIHDCIVIKYDIVQFI